MCGRPRAVYRKFGICRICFRKLADQGLIPGVRKSSWEWLVAGDNRSVQKRGRRLGQKRFERTVEANLVEEDCRYDD